MAEPQLLAILIIIGFFAAALAGGGYLIYRTMTKPNSHIGSRIRSAEPEASDARESTAEKPRSHLTEDASDDPDAR